MILTIPNAVPSNVESDFRTHDERNKDRDVLLVMPKTEIRSNYGVKGPDHKIVRSSQIVGREEGDEIRSNGGESVQLYNYKIKV